MGLIVDIFLYWLTTWVLKWDEIETHSDGRTIFIPFDEKGNSADSEQYED